MLALVGVGRLGRRLDEHPAGHDVHVQALGEGAAAEGVGGVVRTGLEVALYDGVHHLPVQERAVGRQAHDMLGGALRLQAPGIAGQDVFERSAEDLRASAFQDVLEDVVGAVLADGDHQPTDLAAPADTLDLSQDHGRAGQRTQHLAGQPRGGHAGLEDGENQDAGSLVESSG